MNLKKSTYYMNYNIYTLYCYFSFNYLHVGLILQYMYKFVVNFYTERTF